VVSFMVKDRSETIVCGIVCGKRSFGDYRLW